MCNSKFIFYIVLFKIHILLIKTFMYKFQTKALTTVAIQTILQSIKENPRQFEHHNKPMNLSISALFVCFFALISFLEAKTVSSSKKCSQALAGIIYTPETCAYQYLNKLSKKFLAKKDLLFADQSVANSYLFSFAAAYKIEIELGSAIGTTTKYFPDGTTSPGSFLKYPNIAHANLNFPGFTKGSEEFFFSFIVFSDDGEMYYITFVLPLSQSPIC